MHLSFLLVGTIFLISFVLTMVGLGGGLIFSPLFVILGFAKSQAASISLFLNLIAAASAAFAYARKKMVDFSLSIPLIVSSSLAASLGSFLNVRIDLKPFLIIMSIVLAMAGIRMFLSPAVDTETSELSPAKKITGGIIIGACIGLMGGLRASAAGCSLCPCSFMYSRHRQRSRLPHRPLSYAFPLLPGFWGMPPCPKSTGRSCCLQPLPLLRAARRVPG
jgi:uncharacterized membrane protein YfcA